MSDGTSSERIARFVVGFGPAHYSDDDFHLVARAFLDTHAVACAAQDEPIARILLDSSDGLSGPLLASAWTTGALMPVEQAALVNGAMAHALDYDDVTVPLRGHPSVALLPALVALSENTGSTGRELATAYLAGFEVLCKLGKAMAHQHYLKGWHSTATLGAIAATAASARLLELTEQQTVSALGLAAAQASGIRESFGTMAKPFQVGHCGTVAVRSALLARAGLTAAPEALDGPCGFLTVAGHGEDVRAQLDELGERPLELEASGIAVKKYPNCYATHAALDGILEIVGEHGIRLAEVSNVKVIIESGGLAPLIHHHPWTGLEGKFSMEYAITGALLDGDVRLASFSDGAVRRRTAQSFLQNVNAEEGAGPSSPRWTALDVQVLDGSVLQKKVEAVRGSARLPLSDDELIMKVENCLAFGRVELDAREFAGTIFDSAAVRVVDMLPARKISRVGS